MLTRRSARTRPGSLPHAARAAHVSRGCGLAVALGAFLVAPAALADPSPLPPEVGYNYGEIETPRTTAVGGAIRATGTSTSSLFTNPANMAVAKLYHVSAFAQIYPEAARQSYGGAIVDSIISSMGIAGGIGGVWNQQDPEGFNRESTDFRGGLALPIGDVLFIGLAGRAFAMSQNGTGPLGNSLASGGIPNSPILNTFTFDAGATLRPIPEFSIAITGNNLTNPDTAVLPLMGALAIGAGTKDFSLGADAVLESRTYGEAKFRFMGGGEVLVADLLNLRAGYRFDQGLESHALSFGLGYVEPKFAIDAAVRRSIVGTEYTAVVFGFSIHIEAMGLGASPEADF